MTDQFIQRAEGIIDALLDDPDTAMWAGDHRADSRLPDYSAAGVAERIAMLREASHTLTEIDLDELDTADVVDVDMLSHQVAAKLFALTETRDYQWDPLLYNPGMLFNTLLLRRTSEPETRAEAIRGRLEAVPDALAAARANLRDVPEIFATTAAAQFRGTARLLREQLPALLAEVPGMRPGIEPAAESAQSELESFADWLTRLPAGPSPRLGRRLWEAKLWYTLDTPLGASAILDRAWRRLDEVSAELYEVTAELASDGEPSAETTARMLRQLAADRPDNDTVVQSARRDLAETTDFVAQHDLVGLLDDPVEVVVMPEFARGVAAAYCDPPGALETAPVPTFYAISPTPSDWDTARAAAFYAEYNHHMLRNLTVHEAMPGHYLQLAHARRYRGNTRTRAVIMNGPFVEGWAVYSEELMADHGYGGAAVRTQQLKMQLRMIINTIIDQLVHCEDYSQDEAMRLMTERGFQSEAEAAGKWQRALLSSTQLSEYFVGYTEVAEIAAARPTGTSLRDWHDAMLGQGNVPPRHLRTLLGI